MAAGTLGQRDGDEPVAAAGEEHGVPLEALGRVQRGQRDALDRRGVLGGDPLVEVADQVGDAGPRARRRRGRRPAWPAPSATPTARGRPHRSSAPLASTRRRRGRRGRGRGSGTDAVVAAGRAPQQQHALAHLRAGEEPLAAADEVGDVGRRRAPPRTPPTGRWSGTAPRSRPPGDPPGPARRCPRRPRRPRSGRPGAAAGSGSGRPATRTRARRRRRAPVTPRVPRICRHRRGPRDEVGQGDDLRGGPVVAHQGDHPRRRGTGAGTAAGGRARRR